MNKKIKFTDSAVAPIIAIDFDGTINVGGEDTFPVCGKPRKYAKEVINFLHNIGCKVVIWTSRDVAYNQEERVMYDHLTPMIDFMTTNNIEYDAINKSVQFAPYHYNGRKVYAHMYVDDRGYGWNNDENIFIGVLRGFLTFVVGMDSDNIDAICDKILNNNMTDTIIEMCKEEVNDWRSDK